MKTEFLYSKLDIPKLKIKYGDTNRVGYFKYLSEMIELTGLKRIAQKTDYRESIKHLDLSKMCISKNVCQITLKLHYNTVIKPIVTCASEILSLNRKLELQEIKKEERKIIRKILRPQHRGQMGP